MAFKMSQIKEEPNADNKYANAATTDRMGRRKRLRQRATAKVAIVFIQIRASAPLDVVWW
eukprot:scaffold9363_cov75-Skeletonema_marinoi.AAC.6